MKIKAVAALAALGLGMLGVGTAARADLQIDQKTVIDCPGLKQMFQEIPPDQRAPLLKMLSPMLVGTPWQTTTYLQGGRMRTDMGQTSVIVNTGGGGAVTLDRQSHRYSLGSYDPFQSAAGQVTCRITPTTRTATLLGHAVRGYQVAMTSSVLPNSTITGELWSATDLPTPPAVQYAGTAAAAIAGQMAQIKGMPLAYTLVYHNTPVGDIAILSSATAIKNTPLTADVFRIPADFQRGAVRTATAMPSTGFPLGDGMPLDSLGAVTDAMATGGGTTTAANGANPLGLSSGLQELLPGLMGGQSGAIGGLGGGNLSALLGQLMGGSGSGGTADLSSLIGQLAREMQSLEDDN